MLSRFVFVILFAFLALPAFARRVEYPYPVKYFELSIENQKPRMAYMDVSPAASSNGKTAILFHGKNFNGYYWKDVIPMLTKLGYRVVVPDQIGWGKSDKPNIHYSFHLLAANSKKLLDSLGVGRVSVIGHSMGGMLATRFALMYPETVDQLILENPIGLEDYRTFVPYTSVDAAFQTESKATYESYKEYQKSYYPVWKPEYEQYVAAQAEALDRPDVHQTFLANALTSQMIYEQPIVYELKNITAPTLLIIGQADRTIVGKNLLTKTEQTKHGNYPQLGRMAHRQIKNSKLLELPGVGHIPHIQTPEKFESAIRDFSLLHL